MKKTKLPRVAYAVNLVPGAQFGTLEEQMCVLAKKFEENDSLFLPLFIAPHQNGNLDDFTSRGIRPACINLLRFRMSTLFELAALLKKNRIDICHWNLVHPIRNPYVWGLTLLHPSLRHWFTDHISRTDLTAPLASGPARAIKDRLARRYDVVVCVSEYVRKIIASQGSFANTVTLLHFVNIERFAPNETARRQLRESETVGDRIVALFVGYLIPEKGVDVALRAMAQLPDRLCLWIVGGGPDEPRIKALIEKLGLSHRVRLFGAQSQVERYMQAADLLICPSIWAEAAGLVNIEAQSSGLPVVGSRIGGIPEYVMDQQTGLLFEPGDSNDLAQSLRRLVDEPGLLCRLARASRPWAVENYSAAARAPHVLSTYQKYGV